MPQQENRRLRVQFSHPKDAGASRLRANAGAWERSAASERGGRPGEAPLHFWSVFKPASAARVFYHPAILKCRWQRWSSGKRCPRRIVPTLQRGNVLRTLQRPVDWAELARGMSCHSKKTDVFASSSLTPRTLERPACAPTLERGSDQPPASAAGVLVRRRCIFGVCSNRRAQRKFFIIRQF